MTQTKVQQVKKLEENALDPEMVAKINKLPGISKRVRPIINRGGMFVTLGNLHVQAVDVGFTSKALAKIVAFLVKKGWKKVRENEKWGVYTYELKKGNDEILIKTHRIRMPVDVWKEYLGITNSKQIHRRRRRAYTP